MRKLRRHQHISLGNSAPRHFRRATETIATGAAASARPARIGLVWKSREKRVKAASWRINKYFAFSLTLVLFSNSLWSFLRAPGNAFRSGRARRSRKGRSKRRAPRRSGTLPRLGKEWLYGHW